MSLWSNSRVAALYKGAEAMTGPHAKLLLEQAGLSKARDPLIILDNACGTGVVSSLLHESDLLDASTKDSLQLICGDISDSMVQAVKEMIDVNNWKGAKAQVVDAQKTGLPDEHFTHIITNFGIMLMPDPDAALRECFRMLKPGGICAFSTWQSLGWIPDFRAAINTIPGAPKFPDIEVFRASLGKGDWHRVDYFDNELSRHGFENIELQVRELVSESESPAAFAKLFATINVLLQSKFWSEEEKEKYGESVEPALLKYMTEKYGEGNVVAFPMTSILATARKPTN